MTINSIDWTVRFDDNLSENTLGQTNYDTLTIMIRSQSNEQNTKRTLLHEIVHAYLYSFGFGPKEQFSVEEVCDFIGSNASNLMNLIEEAYYELKKTKQ